MKILKLRFANLNSLAGEWAIDFTISAYQQDGIFAITGPTGAGKSTVLDAICLGLYGSTPRLDAITEGTNDIMSRGRGECFAEVTFSTTQGCFMARWSQRRSRKNPKGKLQSPVHQLSEWPSGVLREERSSRVQSQVASLTGLDFRRFTRSMLLAQGGFAAFLQAKPDERAPLLEQLTGTEVYSTVSRTVHKLRNDTQTQVSGLQAQLDELRPLPADARQQLEQIHQDRQRTLATLSQQMEQTRRDLNTQLRLNEIQTQHATSVAVLEQITERHRAFETTRARLRRAEAALHVTPLLHQLQKHQSQVDLLTLRLNEARKEIDRISGQRDLQSQQTTELRNQLEKLTASHERLKPKLTAARTIELRIEHEHTQLQLAEEKLHASRSQAETAVRTYQELELQLHAETKRHSEQLATLDQRSADEALVSQFGRIEERFIRFNRCIAAHRRTLESLKTHNELLFCTTQAHEAANADLQKRDEALCTAQEKQDHLTKEWRLLSEELSNATLRSETLQRASAHSALDKLEQSLDAWQETYESVHALAEEVLKTKKHIADASTEAQSARQEVDLRAAQLALLEEQHNLVRSINTLTALRAKLTTGEACPLCGSQEHPYKTQPAPDMHRPSIDASALTVSQARAEVSTAQELLREKQSRLVQMQAELEHRATAESVARSRLDDLRSTVYTQASHLLQSQTHPLVPSAPVAEDRSDHNRGDSEKMSTLRSALNSTREFLKAAELQTGNKLQQLQRQEDRLRTLKEKTDLASRERARAQNKLEATRLQLSEAQRTAARAEGELHAAENEAQAAQGLLMDVCKPWLINPEALSEATTADLNIILEGLQRRAHDWQQLKIQAEAQAEACRDLQTCVQSAREQSNYATAQADHQKVSLASKRDQLYDLKSELRRLLVGTGFSSAARADESQTLSIATTRDACDRSATTLHETEKRLAGLHEATAIADAQLNSQQDEIFQLKRKVQEACAQRDFLDSHDVTAASLTKEELESLQSEERQLDQQMIESNALFESSQKRLEQQLCSAQGLPDEASLSKSMQLLIESEKEHLEDLGRIKAELAAQEQILQRTNDLRQKLTKTQSHLQELSILHDLIGSSDGKKFRNFAQTLTLRLMLGHANVQLQKMSDRYFLVPDDQRVLELAVIDRYQADETRSVRNLSGGESFIISLALALGLSQMASENVRVESLFLDEGFGTLDSESLDVALDALSQLRMSGKQIGVISHIDALKERLGLKITVSPTGGGRSVIAGPGCARLDAV